MDTPLKVAVLQMTSVDDVSHNLNAIMGLLTNVTPGTDLVSLPENALFQRGGSGSAMAYLQLTDPAFKALAKWAEKNQCAVHVGAAALEHQGQRTNSTVLITPDGAITAPYAKIHLFDADLEGERRIRESDSVSHGDKPFVWIWRGWRLGLSICYDLRFSELYQFYARQAVDAVLIPSSFTVPTGNAHWHILLKARAIESQCFVIASAQEGEHRHQTTGESRKTFGHSLVVDPWGTILAEAQSGPQCLNVTLERERLTQVRKQIPMAQHRRL